MSKVRRRVLTAVYATVVVLTIVNHARWTPALFYPLYPGITVSLLITGGHGSTLTLDKIGFAAELVTNLAFYSFVAAAVMRWMPAHR
jgi:hypothetical protein